MMQKLSCRSRKKHSANVAKIAPKPPASWLFIKHIAQAKKITRKLGITGP